MPGPEQVNLNKQKGTAKIDLIERGRLSRAYRFILLLFTVFAGLSIGFYVYFIRATAIQQANRSMMITGVSLGVILLGYLVSRRGLVLLPGFLVLLGATFIFGGNEAVWQGLTLYHLSGGLLLIFITGNAILPRQRVVWAFGAAGYLAFVYLVNNYLQLNRYNAEPVQLLNIYAVAANLFCVLALFILLLQLTQYRTIRTRMTFAFVMLVLVPVVITTATSNYLGRRSSQDQVTNQLSSVATLKEAEINSWLGSLEPNLYIAVTQQGRQEQQWMMETLVDDYPSTQVFYLDIYNRVKSRFEQTIEQGRVFEEVFLMNLDGTVILSTLPENEGKNFQGRDYLTAGKEGFFVTPPTRSPETGQIGMIATIPFYDQQGNIMAVIGGQVNMDRLNQIMSERAGLGNTGETYIVSPQHYLLTNSRFEGWEIQGMPLHSEGITNAVDKKLGGSGVYNSYRGVPVLGVYTWLPQLNIALMAEQDLNEAFTAANRLFLANALTAVFAIAITIVASLFITRRITKPLENLGHTVEQFAAGDLSLYASVEQEDEIGALARSFNSMTDQIRGLIGGLEHRVAERTQELERRSLQLRLAAEVARDAASTRDLDELLTRAVNLIRERYGFYHAGLFLIDERREFAVLAAATGDAGRKMLEAGHKLKVGETGIVGFVTGFGQSRMAHDVGSEAIHFKNPVLPLTRSEVALPLKIGDTVIGALDVQSDQPSAFNAETVEVLQIMTDQLAVAIQNLRMLKQMEKNVKELEAAYGRYTMETWRDFFKHSSQMRGFLNRGLGPEQVSTLPAEAADAWKREQTVIVQPQMQAGENGQNGSSTIAVPMKLRGQTVGVVNLRIRGNVIPAETVALFEDIVNRLSLSLDNVRLLEETNLRSEQINLLQEVTAIAAAHVNLNDLLTAVAQKLREGFELSNCMVLLLDPDRQGLTVVADERSNLAVRNSLGDHLTMEGNQALQELFHTQKSTMYTGVQNNPCLAEMQFLLEERETHNLMMMPLVSRGEVIGVINMESGDTNQQFVEDDVRLADQVSLQVSTAIDVARLFEQTERRAERERMISEITSKVRASTNLDVIMRTAVQELAEALQIPKGAIQLSGDDGGFLNE